ncbi:MAG TPA: ATP-binding protein [Thermoanaerobaculaceae bacterium]|nr:ATP-binding protein [Thermoanaerobaculaceae bacterium]
MAVESAPGLENLVNQIAHDVRNHAFTIGLQAEMGQRRSASSPETRQHFDTIIHQVDALRRYLDSLLLYGRPVKLAPASVDPVALVVETVEAVRTRHAFESALPIRIESAGEVGRATWDARAVGHALQAVLDNAIRSAAPPPEVAVSVRGETAQVVIEVVDGGSGIPADVISRLGVPMAVRRAGSAGLGLAIARKMLQAHGGRLEIESPGHGTTVRLVLPRDAAPPAV